MSAAEPRAWRCPCGRYLGEVVRRGRVRRLVLLEGHEIAGAAWIRCCACGEVREWHSGQEHIDELLRRRGQIGREPPP